MPRKNQQKSNAAPRGRQPRMPVLKEAKSAKVRAVDADSAGPMGPLGAAYGNALAQANREVVQALLGPSQAQGGAVVPVDAEAVLAAVSDGHTGLCVAAEAFVAAYGVTLADVAVALRGVLGPAASPRRVARVAASLAGYLRGCLPLRPGFDARASLVAWQGSCPAPRRAAKAASQGPRPRGRPMGYRMGKAPCPGCGLPVAVRADDGGPSRKHSCSSARSLALRAKAERQSAARRADAGAAPVGVVA